MKENYTIIIHKEEDGYWAECQEIKGCFAQAKTIDELKKLMKQSIYMYFNDEEVNDCGKDIELELSYA